MGPMTVTEEFEEQEFERDQEELVLDPGSQAFIDDLVGKIIDFMHELIGFELFPYQIGFARRLIESVLINDGEEVTALFARQSGKSETVADVVQRASRAAVSGGRRFAFTSRRSTSAAQTSRSRRSTPGS